MIRGQILSGAAGGEALDAAFAIREAVFVTEQGYALEIERDERDPVAAHALIWEDDRPVATGRLYLDDAAQWHIGRVAVLKEARGRGFGDLAMRMLLMSALQFGADAVYLGSQEHAVGFYERLGFRAYGDPYLDEGQPHRRMVIEQDALDALFTGCAGCSDGACPARLLDAD